MKPILKKTAVLSILSVFLITLIIPVFAHPGSLDENGGHYDRSTGEYHYHHGYSAHQHTNGECPYDFHDNANTEYTPQDEKPTNSSNSTTKYYYDTHNTSESTTEDEKTQHESTSSIPKNLLSPIVLVILPIAVFGTFVILFFLFSWISTLKEKYCSKQRPTNIQTENQKLSPEENKNTLSTVSEKPVTLNKTPEQNKQTNKQNDDYYIQIGYHTGYNKRIGYPTAYNKEPDKPNEYYEQRDKQRTLNDLVAVSLSALFGSFPKDIRIQDNFELLFENSDDNAPYGRYTIYIETDNPVIHKHCDCHTQTRKVLALNCFGAHSFRFCDKCWDKKSKKQTKEFFSAEWYDSYQMLIDRMEIHNISPKEITEAKKKKLLPILNNSEFQFWRFDVHTTIPQMQRIYRAKEITIIDYNPDTKEAKVQGSKGDIYITSFSSCTCKDFSIHHLPCKHMYKLAATHGGIDFTKYV